MSLYGDGLEVLGARILVFGDDSDTPPVDLLPMESASASTPTDSGPSYTPPPSMLSQLSLSRPDDALPSMASNLSMSPGTLSAPMVEPMTPVTPGGLQLQPQWQQLKTPYPPLGPSPPPAGAGAGAAPGAGAGAGATGGFSWGRAAAGGLAGGLTGIADMFQQQKQQDQNAKMMQGFAAQPGAAPGPAAPTAQTVAQAQKQADVLNKLNAMKPNPALASKLAATQARLAGTRAKQQAFSAAHPRDPGPSKQEKGGGNTAKYLMIGGGVVATGAVGYLAWKKWGKK